MTPSEALEIGKLLKVLAPEFDIRSEVLVEPPSMFLRLDDAEGMIVRIYSIPGAGRFVNDLLILSSVGNSYK